MMLERNAEAQADFEQAIRLDPRSSLPYRNRGVLRLRLKDYRGAIRDLDQAITLDPKLAGPLRPMLAKAKALAGD